VKFRYSIGITSCSVGAAVFLVHMPCAIAQVIGIYKGQNSEGFATQIEVDQGDNGGLVVSEVSDGGVGICRDHVTTIQFTFGAGQSAPITNGEAALGQLATDLYFSGSARFKGNDVKGELVDSAPAFPSGSKAPPTKATACMTKKHTFFATLSEFPTGRPKDNDWVKIKLRRR
jgi:hypothetical protein